MDEFITFLTDAEYHELLKLCNETGNITLLEFKMRLSFSGQTYDGEIPESLYLRTLAAIRGANVKSPLYTRLYQLGHLQRENFTYLVDQYNRDVAAVESLT